MKSFIDSIPVSPTLHYRSFSKKHNSDYSSSKDLPKRSVSKKFNINSYGYCPKDIETLKDENIKLKGEIQGYKTEILQQKKLIISLQRMVSTSQFRESISTQKNININLKQEKYRLAEKLKIVEEQLNKYKRETKNVDIEQLQQQRNWYKQETARLKRIILKRIKNHSLQSQDELNNTYSITVNGNKQSINKQEEQGKLVSKSCLLKEEMKQNTLNRSLVSIKSKTKLKPTFQVPNQDQDQNQIQYQNQNQIQSYPQQPLKSPTLPNQQRLKTSTSNNRLKRGFKDSIVMTRNKIKQNSATILQNINIKFNKQDKIIMQNQKQRHIKVGFSDESILPYNNLYQNGKKNSRTLGSFRNKSMIEKKDFEQPFKRNFVM